MSTFLLGVIEGFYGKPWTFEQRKRLFVREKEFDFMYFMYAPKDEAKHRRLWRELHDEIELLYLKELINSASEQDVAFVYAISPGLDMIYSSEQEVSLLEMKLKQVYDLGCRNFALLFDDIDTHFHCSLDHKHFSSLAKAQVHVSNSIYKSFSADCTFMFCPTEYCSSRAYPSLEESEYLRTVGSDLCQAFYVLWTGDKVVPEEITLQHIKPVRKILKRKPLIWENLHANDYDPRRVFLGPYFGRDPQIIDEISGVLTNPNNQFELNYIPLLSLSLWYNNAVEKTNYDCNRIVRICAEKWRVEVCRQLPCEERLVTQIAAATNNSTETANEPSSSLSSPSSADATTGNIGGSMGVVAGGGDHMDFEVDSNYSISVEDIQLILSFNYLPYKAGPDADALFDEAKSLVESSSCKSDNWAERGHSLIERAGKVIAAIDNLLDCPNRQVAFEIYPMLSETRVIMDMLIRHFNWMLGESCPLSEEKRAGFYTRFGINGQFNSLLTSIMEPNSWVGGVMILPLAERFVPKAAKFMCSMVEYPDSAALESLITLAIEQAPILCYVMLNSQDDVLALSIGYEKAEFLSSHLESIAAQRWSTQGSGSRDAAMTPPPQPPQVGNHQSQSTGPTSDEDFLNSLSQWAQWSKEASLSPHSLNGADVCSVFVFNSPKMVPKMLQNFLLSVNTAVKTMPSISASRFIFDQHFVMAHSEILESMEYLKEENTRPDRFSLFYCKRSVDQSMME